MIKPETLDEMCTAVRIAYASRHITGVSITRYTSDGMPPHALIMPVPTTFHGFDKSHDHRERYLADFRAALTFFLNANGIDVCCRLLLVPPLHPEVMREVNFILWELVETHTGRLAFEASTMHYASVLALPGVFEGP